MPMRAAFSMMRQIFLVTVNPDNVFQRAGHAGFFVRLELRDIKHNIRIYHVPSDKVLVLSWCVRSLQQIRVVHGDPKFAVIGCNRL